MAGAFDRQLPEPDSHFLPRGVCEPVVVGVVFPTEGVDSLIDLSEGASCRTWLPLGVFVVVLVVLASGGPAVPVLGASAGGASVFGLDFLRGLIPTGKFGELNRR